MKFGAVLWSGMVMALCLGARGGEKTVMVHYMPWFVSQPYSGYRGVALDDESFRFCKENCVSGFFV